MVKVQTDTKFTKPTGRVFDGFYLDGYLKSNLDDYLIKAVKYKFDGTMIVSGIEGAGKTTLAFTIARYCDPTFPGPLLEDGTGKRSCDRIVFSGQQILEQIDKAKIGQAIVIDEAIMGMFSQDHGNEMHKILLKKFVTIRKKRLFIFLVIPSIFLLRRYFAIFRTRAMIHCTVKDGIKRGFFKFYSYNTKKDLYLKGLKEFNQNAVKSDFIGTFTDTEGFFCDVEEYDKKKEEAILSLTKGKSAKRLPPRYQNICNQRDTLLKHIYDQKKAASGPLYTLRDYSKYLKNELKLKATSHQFLSICFKRVIDGLPDCSIEDAEGKSK